MVGARLDGSHKAQRHSRSVKIGAMGHVSIVARNGNKAETNEWNETKGTKKKKKKKKKRKRRRGGGRGGDDDDRGKIVGVRSILNGER